ncbi:MAG: DNA-directed RNA polymerase subunit beta [Proteobacteria bacterium]|nr:DNA-directed RNA polymerase subunit beta [Pseudomonadota bacterium]
MDLSFTQKKSLRKNFGKLIEGLAIPNLIEVQKNSYNEFLSSKSAHENNDELTKGIQKTFHSIFPIEDVSEKSTLEYISYKLEKPKFDVLECKQRSLTYSASIKANLRLVVYDIDTEANTKQILSTKEQEVFIGELPLMTKTGTFIVNGVERVVVNQMHRSPGVFFDHDKGKTHSSGKLLFNCRIIPGRGSWLDFEFDPKDILYFRIDRKKKLPITTLLYALGISREQVIENYYTQDQFTYNKETNNWSTKFIPENYKRPVKLPYDLIDAKTNKKFLDKSEKLNLVIANKLKEKGLNSIIVSNNEIIGRYIAHDIKEKNGEYIIRSGFDITDELLQTIISNEIYALKLVNIDPINKGPYLLETLKVEKNIDKTSALNDIYRILRPGEPPTIEVAEQVFKNLYFNNERYDLSEVGRVKLNAKLNLTRSVKDTILYKEDILAIIQLMLDLRDGKGDVDDIDHLGNRRVRSVGELVENQFRIGLLRMERTVREKMSTFLEIESAMPQDLVNAKPITTSLKDFFATSALSQFMDQTNPLSEITHKRRVSALGPGGLTRERAGFEVRDVHPTHYGRICPIETPEGPNIGLINSLATYSRVNKYGYIDSPYKKVVNGKVTKEIFYLSAIEEEKFTIAQANSPINKDGTFEEELVSCRRNLNFLLANRDSIDYIDVSPKQLVSVAAAIIPFLENDDANRALMGSNMMRQAVPLLKPDSPIVGTGMESDVALDSGVVIVSRRNGIVDKIDGKRIVVKATDDKDLSQSAVDIYNLSKFKRSNQNTCINQRPLVKVGDVIKTGDIIADGPATKLGELALGKNVTVAFMPWQGYNFEDSILISERCVTEDVFTSIHIEEYECMARDTKLGAEEITRDIPNVSEESLRNLDESGIVYVGAEVKPGDILVGKVTPKSETSSSPEEKLLRSIFGEKATDVRDSSLKLKSGGAGVVIDVKVFNRHGIEKDERSIAIERAEIELVQEDKLVEEEILNRNIKSRSIDLLKNKKLDKSYKSIDSNTPLQVEHLNDLNLKEIWKLTFSEDQVSQNLLKLKKQFDEANEDIKLRFEDKVIKIKQGDDLLPTVMKVVKVFVAVKRRLMPGDKMAGRHGNKGVVSKIVAAEDMPYMSNGKPVDIVLNPLGVPSRMNVGQILETHLGWACHELGDQLKEYLINFDKTIEELKKKLTNIYGKEYYEKVVSKLNKKELFEFLENISNGVPIATPVFDGASTDDIKDMLNLAKLPTSGQTTLWDGLTGEKFDRPVTVGIIYMMKLNHLVEDKIHARSTGPYSLVTQQPLGGKAQMGGQRFGEMEVWALEAYGAAYTLQEILTVKSDDVAGRTKVYETIVKGNNNFESGVPESFNVLIKEIRALALNIELN